MAAVLVVGSIPLAFLCLVSNGAGLITTRFFIGLLGSAFVPCQCKIKHYYYIPDFFTVFIFLFSLDWVNEFFSTNVIGTANAIAGGWGNMVIQNTLYSIFIVF